jgi:hypothetical protein
MQRKEPAKDQPRKPYSRPEIKRVELTPEESLAEGCKNAGTAAPLGSNCTTMSCMNSGS